MPLANKQRRKEYLKRYAQEHREDMRRNRKRWQEKRGEDYWKTFYIRHREELKAKTREWNHKIKLLALSAYSENGTPRCLRCGVNDIDVLTIDHINGGGNEHRRQLRVGSGTHFFYWLRRNNYPSGFQVLCWNCNVKKRLREGC